MKERYDRIGYSIVKLDENNKAITEQFGDECVSMAELSPNSRSSEVNDENRDKTGRALKRVLKRDELDLLKSGSNAINQRLEAQADDGKEYYLAAGGHAAIVKRSESGYQYLELQHPSDGNGWQNLSDNILYRRFGCKDSRLYAISGYLIEVNSLANSSEFRNLLGYINTAESSQKKGVYGNVR